MKSAGLTREPRTLSEAWIWKKQKTYVVDVCRFTIDTDDDLKSLSLLGASLLGVDLTDVILALRMIEWPRQGRQNIWSVDAEGRSHIESSRSCELSRRLEWEAGSADVRLLLQWLFST